MRLRRVTGPCLLLLPAAACMDLMTPNTDRPDQERVLPDARALAMLDSAAVIAATNELEIPPAWFGNAGMTKPRFLRTIRGYQALLRAGAARGPAERAAVDWSAVIADVDASFPCTGATCENLAILPDPNVWIHGTHLYFAGAIDDGAWAQVSNFVHGMADQSGRYRAWLNAPAFFRTPYPGE